MLEKYIHEYAYGKIVHSNCYLKEVNKLKFLEDRSLHFRELNRFWLILIVIPTTLIFKIRKSAFPGMVRSFDN